MIRCLPLLAAVVLTACVPAQRGDTPATWVDRTAAMRDLSDWSLNGRIGLQLSDRGFNGSLAWEQTNEAMRVNFHGPLGAGAFRISGDPDQLLLETGAGDSYLLDDPESAMEQAFGWGVPLHAMRYWLIGIPHPDSPARQAFDTEGRLALLEQMDWTVVYERFSVFDGWEMPRKLLLESNKNVRIKLIIKQWSLDTNTD